MSNPQLPPAPCQIHVEQREHDCTAALSEGSTPLQRTAVSTLTKDSSLVDLSMDSGGGECEDRYYASAIVCTLRYVLRQTRSIYLHKSTSRAHLHYGL
jgi:hypothetical protein